MSAAAIKVGIHRPLTVDGSALVTEGRHNSGRPCRVDEGQGWGEKEVRVPLRRWESSYCRGATTNSILRGVPRMTTIGGLPAHVLLVHAVVVLVPLTALLVLLVA